MSEQHNSVKLGEIIREFNLEILRTAPDYENVPLRALDINRPGLPLTGFFEHFDTERLLLIGLTEHTYLSDLPAEQRRERFDRLMSYPVPALILTRGLDLPGECMEMAEKHDRTVLRSTQRTAPFMSSLISRLYSRLAPEITRSGVMLEVYGEGILIQGESGVGKSEVAIELLKRGHRLVADDAVEIKETSRHTLMATSPELIRGYMELRGIGVIDIGRLLGMGAIKLNQEIDLVVNLEPWDDKAVYDRFGLESHFTEILGVKVPAATIPVKPGRNLASIVEVAAMNNRNRKMGHNAAQELTDRMDKLFQEQLEGGAN
ncbi:MAG: HPr(Ser) kinase/phosphatase [Lawsonibacter sp.]|jgi:HPr kinase/phosphorylase|nr:HPr(Ser) kinase/phosphatase [Lawsonibacter sp.]MCI8989486.1 HPr(Ser) kinase/phosphatase [Lawsonibacter sp.]MCI9267724.1 HPr(Ser) kinase/phosphatase [Lawsonibacter sp.]